MARASMGIDDVQGEVLAKELTALGKRVKDWGLHGGKLSVLAFREYEATGVLPYSGGFLEQPEEIIADFATLRDVLTGFKLETKKSING